MCVCVFVYKYLRTYARRYAGRYVCITFSGRYPAGDAVAGRLEGAQRLQLLQAYLVALLGNEALRRSDPLLYFVGANYSTARRRVWKAAVVSGSGQNFRLRQPTRAQSRQKHKVQTTI